jgi:hypothetical protein
MMAQTRRKISFTERCKLGDINPDLPLDFDELYDLRDRLLADLADLARKRNSGEYWFDDGYYRFEKQALIARVYAVEFQISAITARQKHDAALINQPYTPTPKPTACYSCLSDPCECSRATRKRY